METIGEYLKLKREDIGQTFDTISGITKIRPQYIEAIEKDDFSLFSSPQILKGYIKLIAKTIDADEEYALGLLEPQLEACFKHKNVEDILGEQLREEKQRYYSLRKRILVIILAGMFIIVIFFASLKILEFFTFRTHYATTISYHVPKKVALDHISKKKSGNNASYSIVLRGKVTRKTWVAVIVDNQQPKTYMLFPGDVEIWQAKKTLKIKIGNAGGINLNYNGKSLGKLGVEKEVVTLNFEKKSG